MSAVQNLANFEKLVRQSYDLKTLFKHWKGKNGPDIDNPA
jgi:hypothetical protein